MSQPIAALRTTLRILPFCLTFSLLAQSSGRQIFNVADYGAARDRSTLATDAFRKAIQAAKAAGGGTIYVPPGQYSSGPIELFSNMTLEVDAGATIEFPVAPLPFTGDDIWVSKR